MKQTYSLLFALVAILFTNCTDVEDVPALYPEYEEVKELSIVDKNATTETKALYSNLWAIQSKGFMFGHHDDLWYGRKWYNEEGRSDTKDVCGDYPAVFSFDVGEIMDDRYQNAENAIRRKVAIEAYNRGEVLTACMHLNNPLTGGDSWDNSNKNVAKEILTEGSETNVKFKLWLDRLADFALNLKGSDGKNIPVIFRPFHEHTQGWSWWGSSCTTQEEFIALWKFTVNYLRDTKGVHNFIYAISPQIDSVLGRDIFLFRWPGNDYVDFLGMDAYHGLNPNTFTSNLFTLSRLSKELKKPCGVTETGVEGIQRGGVPEKNYWTQQILTPASGQFISLIVMWRNAYDPGESGKHFYSAFKGHASEKNFIKMYDSPVSFFSGDLPNMYQMAEGLTVN
ncbi:mannan endo-1,4-beta-mannosidase [Dysgonomonas sp. PFB1-18]|uniref:glycoside hydrolase family 26 protein n=1 Tax=unclassified Dysgonomonas TaxID=2630389 RepID=UPI0024749651|nr:MULTISPECIES: glycosyl hydrolase [unclassified Dysgonomonas]MDH6309066.1 mannan endo-1,4-beta-mannosidase [Dysgonomonas sp. PF1-14]MDH6338817.1 mannan endo-1,4-beta-mannosidase [Dysgonomonas sp. PF1-16]MDH6380155.1 mannan endo-1,4-beta-mannosidase [Dysgonomonas sp. PFB1-18]MDH6397485.1 mannan endo-1,4-beta-mannosidase [Dysgonomonas sp. PF1-23]